jgi:hypothetical protein
MNNSEKLATYTQDEDKQNKNTAQFVLDTTTQTTNNVNKTKKLEVKTIEPNIVLYMEIVTDIRTPN